MAGPVRAYADAMVAAVGPPADPPVVELLAAADGLDAALANPQGLGQAIVRWQAATDAMRHRLVRYLLARMPVPDVPPMPVGQRWCAPGGVHLDVDMGPLTLHIVGAPLRVPDPRDAAAPGIVIGALPPDSVAAHLDAGPVSGDGALAVLPDGVSGALALQLGAVEVAALASLRRADGQPSFAAVFAAGFTPGVQLGFGFQISRVGGVIGIGRGVDEHAVAARLRDGSAGEVLFPLDIGDSARRALAALEAILPPRPGFSVVGPTMRLSWLEVAGQGFCSLDLGVLVELPGPQRVVVVGIARAGIAPVLVLRADVAGVLDFVQRTVSIDASLVDSGLLGIFSVHGDAAFRQCWGPRPYTVLSVGGFYPGFHPEPAVVPPLRRLGMHLDNPVPGISLRAEGYLAATSNTLQLGGRLEAGIRAAGCGAHGFLAVDSLVQFTPFYVHAEVSAGFEVEVFGLTFCGVRLDGTVDGPGPVTIRGRLTVETFLEDFHFDETFTFGGGGGTPPVEPARAAEVLAREEVVPSALRPTGGPDPDVVPASSPAPSGFALVTPRGGVMWSQQRVPLTIPIDRLDGAPLGGVQTVTAAVPRQSGGVDELFAPGSFITLSQSEALNRPAFERLPAGVVSAGGADLTGPPQPQETKPVVFRKVRGEWRPLGIQLLHAQPLPAVLLRMIADRDAAPAVATTSALVDVRDESWVASSDGVARPSATAAHQAARLSGSRAAFAVADADAASSVVLAGL